MEEVKNRSRDIRFYSKKNEKLFTVHSPIARRYAQMLEDDPDVISYKASMPLDDSSVKGVRRIRIRKNYFDTKWSSDFVIYRQSGTATVRELCTRAQLQKLSHIERLELSRRYWADAHVYDWAVVIVPGV